MKRKVKLILYFLILPAVFLTIFLTRREKTVEEPKRELKTNLVSKSAFIGYGNTDNLTVFSAYQFQDEVTVILSSYGYLSRRVICRLFDRNHVEISTQEVTVFPEFTARCQNHNEAHYVVVTLNKKDKYSALTKIEKPRGKYHFSVCLAPIWGSSPKWLELFEFMEFYKLQGADKFFVYTKEVDDNVSKILNFYGKTTEIIGIGNQTACLGRHRCRHEMQLQDCVTRARSVSSFVATVDLDERIFMINEEVTVGDFLRKNAKPSIGEYRFRCQWTLRYSEQPTVPREPFDLPMATWHNTSHVAPMNHTTKSIVDPIAVDSMGVHAVQKMKPGYTVKLVPPEIAVVRHYRLTKGWDFFLKEAESFGKFSNYSVSEKFMNLLEKNVRSSFKSIFG